MKNLIILSSLVFSSVSFAIDGDVVRPLSVEGGRVKYECTVKDSINLPDVSNWNTSALTILNDEFSILNKKRACTHLNMPQKVYCIEELKDKEALTEGERSCFVGSDIIDGNGNKTEKGSEIAYYEKFKVSEKEYCRNSDITSEITVKCYDFKSKPNEVENLSLSQVLDDVAGLAIPEHDTYGLRHVDSRPNNRLTNQERRMYREEQKSFERNISNR